MQKFIDWSQFKDFINTRNVDLLMIEDPSHYFLWADDLAVTIICQLFKDQTADISDFETNYKSTCNRDKINQHQMIKEGRFSSTIDASVVMPNPSIIDFQFPFDCYVWGCHGHVINFGDGDWVGFQIVDVDNILGYGANTVLKDYDEIWCHTIAKSTGAFTTPDGAPGKILGGLYARIIYNCTDATKTSIKFYGDFILTVKS